jgi:hypothetical protein
MIHLREDITRAMEWEPEFSESPGRPVELLVAQDLHWLNARGANGGD